LRKRLAVLVAAAVMLLSMFAVTAPAFAQGEGGCDPQPGESEMNRSPQLSPPQSKPGTTRRDPSGGEHDTSDVRTGFGDRVDECA
jgi:hypothetical protein